MLQQVFTRGPCCLTVSSYTVAANCALGTKSDIYDCLLLQYEYCDDLQNDLGGQGWYQTFNVLVNHAKWMNSWSCVLEQRLVYISLEPTSNVKLFRLSDVITSWNVLCHAP